MTRVKRRLDGTRRGRTVVETAVVLSLVFTLMLGIFEYGNIVMTQQLMTNAAREGSRMAVVSTDTYPATTTANIQTYVTNYLTAEPQITNLNVQVYQADPGTGANIGLWSATPFGNDIAVQIDLDYKPLLPTTLGIIPNPLHLRAKSLMRSEAN